MSSIARLLRMAAVWLAAGLTFAACTSPSNPQEASGPDQSESAPTPLPDLGPAPAPASLPTVSLPDLGPSPTPLPAAVLPDLGPAPDITNEVWLNSDQPLNLEVLHGKVVLVEFWTFG